MNPKKTHEMHRETKRKHIERELEASAGGAVAGAALGAFAGPPGAIAGAVIGAMAGAVVDYEMRSEDAFEAERDRLLDEAIGVSGGEMGAPNLRHLTATIGAYSGGSLGSGADGQEQPAEGPMQSPS
jgi:uncharacterized protein YcfJ